MTPINSLSLSHPSAARLFFICLSSVPLDVLSSIKFQLIISVLHLHIYLHFPLGLNLPVRCRVRYLIKDKCIAADD